MSQSKCASCAQREREKGKEERYNGMLLRRSTESFERQLSDVANSCLMSSKSEQGNHPLKLQIITLT